MSNVTTSSDGRSIRCPYCGTLFSISLDCNDQASIPLRSTDEIMVLPYARDVDIFDPPVGRNNSPWSQIGEDFLGGIKYDRLFGILRIPRALKVYYCVARCPKCGVSTERSDENEGKRGLIDVFVNCTPQIRSLAVLWPQLFSEGPLGQLREFSPRDFLSRFFGSHLAVFTFLLFLYFASFAPEFIAYAQQPASTFREFVTVHFPTMLPRGIMVISLILLIAVRRQLIGLFTNKAALTKLFHVQDDNGLVYWMNWAISRFTGYQKNGLAGNLNAVLVFGGFLSSLILIVTWGLYHIGSLPAAIGHNSYSICSEFVFWLIVSFIFGILIWNQFEIPHYILPSLRRIPMRSRSEDIEKFTRDFAIVVRIGIYAGIGILLMCMTFIALTP